ncbi:MAG TPA: HlyD family efflux transporter periplasmic adaptor subunit [Thioploca sp.]|nr:HlyD family efflux transporter periplasmic adaptor subunit [Thioploca sp.]
MKTILKFLLPLLILAIGFGGFRYMQKTKPKNEPIKIEEQAYVVTIVPVIPTALSPTLTLYGRVESHRWPTLRTPTLSLSANVEVIKVAVLEGEKVKKASVLIRLEDSDSKLNLKQREADLVDIGAQIELEKRRHANNLTALTHEETLLSLTRKSLERRRRLKKQRLSSQSSLEEAQQAVERQMLTITNRRLDIQSHKARLAQLQAKRTRALAMRELARLELARTQIKAPFTGIIAKVAVAVGDRVRSGDALLSVYDNTTLEVRAQIPSRYQGTVLDALAAGYQLKAHTQLNKKTIRLQLDRVSGQINPDSGGIEGIFRVKKGTHLLRLGQFLTLTMSLPRQARVVALPFEAVYGTNRIYKLKDGRMKRLTVERVGEQVTADGKSHILVRSSKLQQGDQVIITQLPNAMEGLKVRLAFKNEGK